MFKDRLFLNGLGIGIMIGALLLQIIGVSGSESNQTQNEPQNINSARQVALYKSELEKMGYRVTEKDAPLFTQAQMDEALNKQEVQLAKEKEEPKTVWGFAVPTGVGSVELVDMLAQIKLIDDKAAFEHELNAKGLSTKIQAKIYVFDKKPSVDDLIAALTDPSGQ